MRRIPLLIPLEYFARMVPFRKAPLEEYQQKKTYKPVPNKRKAKTNDGVEQAKTHKTLRGEQHEKQNAKHTTNKKQTDAVRRKTKSYQNAKNNGVEKTYQTRVQKIKR